MMEISVIQLILQAGYVVKAVFLILLIFSIVSWAIIFYKWRLFSMADRETNNFLRLYTSIREPKELYLSTKRFTISPLASLFRSVYAEKTYSDKEELKRMLKRYSLLEASKLQRYLNFLATTGSTTPFIGLFGTVWGIMNTFRGIGGKGSASLAIVAPGIAEALIATALGLMAAIPAVVAYNYYVSRVNRMIVEIEDFSEELVDYILKQ
ncbi:MAG: protein TolQ [Thermodesulfovibrionales bacterium]|nr:protein TolQ [Thermodesulfovibrionales bacterium]